ncbi:MAG TPA: P-loop NTPase fold protein [Allosphingosinicella sp.]|nr:P-loop NTPase fold protein [Allosphingosinicella sp.]
MADDERGAYPTDPRFYSKYGQGPTEESMRRDEEAAASRFREARKSFQKSTIDPIQAAAGGSISLVEFFQWRNKSGGTYGSHQLMQAVRRASQLAGRRRRGRIEVSAADLLLAVLQIDKIGDVIRPLVTQRTFPSHDTAEADDAETDAAAVLRWDAVNVLAEAACLRHFTEVSILQVGINHVVAAAFLSVDGQTALRSIGVFDSGYEAARDAVANALRPSSYFDLSSPWMGISSEVRSQPPLSPRHRTTLRPEIAADTIEDPDDVAAQSDEDAAALAELILLRSAAPPLAIALLGAWGSGKTTLMRRIQRLVSTTAGTGHDKDEGLVQNVVQVEFNAWTYADSANLLASLAVEIFEQVRQQLQEERSAAANELLNALTARLAAEKIVLERQEQLVTRRDEAVRNAEAKLAVADAKASTVSADALDDLLRDASEKVGADAVPKDLIAKWRLATQGAAAMWRETRKRRWLAFLLLAVGLTATICGVLLQGFASTLPYADLVLASGAVLIVARISLPVLSFMGLFIERRRSRLAGAKDELTSAREALEKARDEQKQAAESSSRAANFVDRYSNDAASSSPVQLLQFLLQDSDDLAAVKRQLGSVAIIRRCFEQMNDVIRKMRGADGPPRIERIIIYIDDLDRCSPRQVVDILEAVHLLLAFECFVVVVAADAAWLHQSLEHEHQDIVVRDQGRGSGTAADYLEKIIQIPFWVRPLVDVDALDADGRYAAYSKLIQSLVGGEFSQSRSTSKAAAAADTDAESQLGAELEGVSQIEAGEITSPFTRVEPTSESFVSGYVNLILTEEEARLLSRLGPVAAKSPRAVKRMVNIYRLIRVRYERRGDTAFLEGGSPETAPYWAVQFAVACEVGLPTSLVTALHQASLSFSAADWERLFDDEPVDASQRETLRRLHESSRWPDIKAAFSIIKEASGGRPGQAEIAAAFEDSRRYSFRLA